MQSPKFVHYTNIFLLSVVFSALLATLAWAATDSSTVGNASSSFSFNPGFHINAISTAFKNAVGPSLQSKFWTFAKGLFGVLAIIELAWACSELALSGKVNLQAVTAMIARQAIVIGICYMILTNGMIWLGWIVDGLRQLGGQVTGLSKDFSPGDIFEQGFALSATMWSKAGIFESVGIFLPVVYINIIFAAAATLAAIAVIQSYFVIAIGLFFLGLGGMRWTRDSMASALRHTVAIGAKLMTMAVLVGVMFNLIDSWTKQIASPTGFDAFGGVANTALLFSGTATVFFGLFKALPDYIASIAGVSIAGSSGLDALVGGAAGGAMGAAAPQVFGRAAGGLYGGLRGGIDAARSGGGAKDIFKASASGSLSGLAGGVAGVNRKFQAMPPSGNGMGPGK